MKLGITLFATDLGITPAELARAVEERGFHSLYLPEHTHLPVGSEPPGLVSGVRLEDYRRSLDPFVALAAAAAVTSRIKLGTGVALVAQHDPITLAKQVATLDVMSGGRFVLGVGFGWNRAEAADHGVAFAQRREIAADKLACMTALWREPEAAGGAAAGGPAGHATGPDGSGPPGAESRGVTSDGAGSGGAASRDAGAHVVGPYEGGSRGVGSDDGGSDGSVPQDSASHGAVSYEGPFASVAPSYVWPKPVQQPRPRILVGGGAGPKLFAFVAQHADGWMPIGGGGLSESLPRLRAAFEEAGRDPATAEVVPFGTVPDAAKLAHLEALGVDEVVLRVPNGPRDDVLRTLDSHATHL